MSDRASVLRFHGLTVKARARHRLGRNVDLTSKHFAQSVSVGAKPHGDSVVFSALQAHQPRRNGFFEVEGSSLNRYRIEFYTCEGVDKSSHGSVFLTVKSAADCDRALTVGPGVSQAPGPHHSDTRFVSRNLNPKLLNYILCRMREGRGVSLYGCLTKAFIHIAGLVSPHFANQSACRDFPPCCAANLPLSAGADGGLYSGHGFSSFPHGAAYRGAVLARLSGPRSPLLALRSVSADRSCGVAA